MQDTRKEADKAGLATLSLNSVERDELPVHRRKQPRHASTFGQSTAAQSTTAGSISVSNGPFLHWRSRSTGSELNSSLAPLKLYLQSTARAARPAAPPVLAAQHGAVVNASCEMQMSFPSSERGLRGVSSITEEQGEKVACAGPVGRDEFGSGASAARVEGTERRPDLRGGVPRGLLYFAGPIDVPEDIEENEENGSEELSNGLWAGRGSGLAAQI